MIVWNVLLIDINLLFWRVWNLWVFGSMLYLLLFEVVKLLFGDDVEDVNDEFNREDIGDMLIWCGVMFGFDFLLLVGVRLLVFFGYFF